MISFSFWWKFTHCVQNDSEPVFKHNDANPFPNQNFLPIWWKLLSHLVMLARLESHLVTLVHICKVIFPLLVDNLCFWCYIHLVTGSYVYIHISALCSKHDTDYYTQFLGFSLIYFWSAYLQMVGTDQYPG